MGPCTPRATIIIPAFNAEAHIEDCAASALAQTEQNIEVIVVDDGSTDRTMNLLRTTAEKDSRLRILSQPNGGGGSARNRAMAEARGEYLFFLDADDSFSPLMVQHMTAALDKQQADMAICRGTTFNDATGIIEDAEWIYREAFIPAEQPFSWRDMPERIFNTFANVPWNKAFRRSFIEANGLRFQELRRTNDCLFVCSALVRAERIVTINEALTVYRVGGTNNCQATNDSSSLDFFAAFLALQDFLRVDGVYESTYRSFANHALDAVMYNLHSLKSYTGFASVYDHLPAMEDAFNFLENDDSFYYDQEQWLDYKALRTLPQAEWLFNLGRHRHNDIMRMKNELAVLHRDHADLQRRHNRTLSGLAQGAIRRAKRKLNAR